jgi:hypothetical protein
MHMKHRCHISNDKLQLIASKRQTLVNDCRVLRFTAQEPLPERLGPVGAAGGGCVLDGVVGAYRTGDFHDPSGQEAKKQVELGQIGCVEEIGRNGPPQPFLETRGSLGMDEQWILTPTAVGRAKEVENGSRRNAKFVRDTEWGGEEWSGRLARAAPGDVRHRGPFTGHLVPELDEEHRVAVDAGVHMVLIAELEAESPDGPTARRIRAEGWLDVVSSMVEGPR